MSERREKFQGFITSPDAAPFSLSTEQAKTLDALPQEDGIHRIGPLHSFVKEIVADPNVSFNDAAIAIRSHMRPDLQSEIIRRYNGELTVITDLHGMNESKAAMLDRVAENPGEAVTLIGDVLGSPQLERLQKLFYNSLINHSKKLFEDQPDATDEELLTFSGDNKEGEEITVREGFRRLRTYERTLEGKTPEEIEAELTSLSDEDVAREVRRYTRYEHYGHYASNLSEDAKKALTEDVVANAQRLIDPLRKIRAKDVPVVVMQGNWEAALPVDYVPGTDQVIRLPEDQRILNVKEFFEQNGITFLDTLGALETHSMLQVFVPFDVSTELGSEKPEEAKEEQLEIQLEGLKHQVDRARKKGKPVVLISHAVPVYDIHNLDGKAKAQNKENREATRGIQRVIASTLPDRVFYGHIHANLKDSDGQETEANTFNIVVKPGGGVALDTGTGESEGLPVIATYGRMAEEYVLSVPKQATERQVTQPHFKRNSKA